MALIVGIVVLFCWLASVVLIEAMFGRQIAAAYKIVTVLAGAVMLLNYL